MTLSFCDCCGKRVHDVWRIAVCPPENVRCARYTHWYCVHCVDKLAARKSEVDSEIAKELPSSLAEYVDYASS